MSSPRLYSYVTFCVSPFSIAIIKYLRLGIHKEDRNFFNLVIWDAVNLRLGSSFILPQVSAYGRWSNTDNTDGNTGNRIKWKPGRMLEGSGSLLYTFHRERCGSQDNYQISPLDSVLWRLQYKRHLSLANKPPTGSNAFFVKPALLTHLSASDPSGICHHWTHDIFHCLMLLRLSLVPTIIFAPLKKAALWLLLLFTAPSQKL